MVIGCFDKFSVVYLSNTDTNGNIIVMFIRINKPKNIM